MSECPEGSKVPSKTCAVRLVCSAGHGGEGMGDAREKGEADEDGGGGAGDGAEGVLCHSSYAAGPRGVCSGLLLEVDTHVSSSSLERGVCRGLLLEVDSSHIFYSRYRLELVALLLCACVHGGCFLFLLGTARAPVWISSAAQRGCWRRAGSTPQGTGVTNAAYDACDACCCS